MRKSRSLAILMLVVACLLVFACKTTGTPARSAGTPAKSAGASSQSQASGLAKAAKPIKSASKKKAAKLAKQSKKVKPVAAARLKNLAIKTVHKLTNPSKTVGAQSLKTMRAIIYAALAAILLVAVGATVAARVRRHRKLTPSPAGARP